MRYDSAATRRLVHQHAAVSAAKILHTGTPGTRRLSAFECLSAWILGLGGLLLTCFAAPALGTQTDIPGPAGSSAFGTATTVLTNGNIVVSDPEGLNNAIGVVYLYTPAGVLISTLKGHAKNDHVGNGGVTALGNGNYVVVSADWSSPSVASVGAVTWADGAIGIVGV